MRNGRTSESAPREVPEPPPFQVEPGPLLDLHTFRPSDLPELLPEWFQGCRARGILVIRVVHGKGTGALRTGVHSLLKRMPELVSAWSWPAPEAAGGWGATVVQLHPPDVSETERPNAGG